MSVAFFPNLNRMEDAQLWDELRAGQKPALEKIYRQQVEALFRYGRGLTHNEPLIEDAIQELFIELWKRHNSLGPTDAIRPYLLVALRRKLVRMLQRKDQQSVSWEDETPPEAAEEGAESGIIERESEAEERAQLSGAMASLSPRQQEILHLKYFQGLEYKDIAEVLGINYQSVRNTASAALKALRKSLSLFFLLWFL